MSVDAPVRVTTEKVESSSLSFRSGLLQRKCACGSSTPPVGDLCEECQGKRLQRKLVVGTASDPLEAEADRVADQILAAPRRQGIAAAPLRVQRFPSPDSAAETSPASVELALASPGRPMDAGLRQEMEGRFGHDFSEVRIHCGAAADRSTRDVAAEAFTVGRDIVFADGHYAPGSTRGRHLLAHELTHVVQQSWAAAAPVLRRRPSDRNKAQDQAIPREKWSEDLEGQYRRSGDLRRADAMRACRLDGAPACSRILTMADVQCLYDANLVPMTLIPAPTLLSACKGKSDSKPQPGDPVAGAGMAGLAVAARQAAAGGGVNFGLGAANSNAAAQAGARLSLVPEAAPLVPEAAPLVPEAAPLVPEAAPLVEAAPAAEAAPLGAAAAAPALAVVAPLVITGAHWYMWKAFQDKLIALGYVLLEDPLRVCIGGCHSNSTPESPKWRDLDESTPLFRNHPFQQVPGNPFPTTPWLRPGYTEMTPVDAKRATPQTTTRTAPLTPPLPTARTKPDPEDDKQRKKKCEPHLELPKGKKVHWGLYQDAIEFNQLASYPTAIINRRRTTAYERISNQVTKWTKGVDPEKGGKMTRKVLQRGIDLLGADSKCRSVTCIAERRQRVIRPDWTPSGKTTQMDVDHIIELQVGYLLEGSGSLDTFANYELLDSSTNSSVGPTLDSAIQRERNRLKRDCPRDPNQSGFDFWETVPMVFAPPLFEGGGKGPGERWTKADIISGKHLDVYEALRRKRKGGR